MKSFEEASKDLNIEQKLAVNTADGPILVIAGAGTGKTELLAVRIAKLIKDGLADPNNILCLTFTNKAALNMRDRLIGYAGFEAQATTVKTFHSFAAELMNQYPEHFWSGARLQTVPDAKAIEIIENILVKLPYDNPLALKFVGHYTQTKSVRSGLKLVKEAGLTPEKLRAIINLNLSYIAEIEPLLIEILNDRLSIKKLDDLYEEVGHLPEIEVSEVIRPLRPLKDVLMDSLGFAIDQDKEIGKTSKTSKWKSDLLQNVDGQKKIVKEVERNNWWLKLADVYEQYRDELHAQGYYDYSDMLVEAITQLEQNDNFRAEVQERFLYVHVDEFQDSNAAQLRLAHLIADHYTAEGKPNLMVVGDDDQTIFKFNGAELNNMLGFERAYKDVKKIVLVKNYRSTQAILDTADKIISHAGDRLVYRDPSISKKTNK